MDDDLAWIRTWAKRYDASCDDPKLAREIETAREQCARWRPVRWRAGTQRVGTEVQQVMVAKFVALYLVDPDVPETERGYEWAVHKAAEVFGISERTVQAAISAGKHLAVT
jgi:hypothetical protein